MKRACTIVRRAALRPLMAALFAFATLAVDAQDVSKNASPDDDANRPVNIESDTLAYDDLKQVAVFTGNVVLTRGSLLLRSDRLEVRQTPEGFQYATAFGNGDRLASFRQRRAGTDQYVEGYAQRIDFDGRNDIVTLNQRAQMRRLEAGSIADELSGHTITYNNRTDVYNVASGASATTPGNPQGRVRATIAPRPASDAAKAPAPAPLPLRPDGGLGTAPSK